METNRSKMTEPLQTLCIQNLSHSYEKKVVLSNISFDVQKGDVFFISGNSGSGKTTLLQLIAGLIPVQQGYIQKPDGNIRMLFQEPRLFPWLSVEGNLHYALQAAKIPKTQWKELVDDWLNVVGLPKRHSEKIQNLSGGMKQRVALARVMCSQPQVLLLDEPFSSLHEELRMELWNVIHEITMQKKIFTLLVSHHIEFSKTHRFLQLS